jgi:hypothetical protein
MKLFRNLLLAASFLGATSAVADAPRVFVNVEAYAAGSVKWLLSNAQICGAHIVFAWRAIDNGSGAYDWSSVDNMIKPWISAGKKVGISFVGVDEVFQQEGQSNTTVLATPDYVMKQVDVINCPAITRHVMSALKDMPPTPVYWEPGYVQNWKKFIQAAIVKYESNPGVAYLRFGIGAADETFPMTSTGVSPECTAAWSAHGMGYQTWLKYAIDLIDYVGLLHPTVPISFDMNQLAWQTSNLQFATAISAEAAKYHFLVGNEGFSGRESDWNALYSTRRQQTQTYAQTLNPAVQQGVYGGDIFPSIVQAGQGLGIQVYEINPAEWRTPADAAAIAALGTPQTCQITRDWSSVATTGAVPARAAGAAIRMGLAAASTSDRSGSAFRGRRRNDPSGSKKPSWGF